MGRKESRSKPFQFTAGGKSLAEMGFPERLTTKNASAAQCGSDNPSKRSRMSRFGMGKLNVEQLSASKPSGRPQELKIKPPILPRHLISVYTSKNDAAAEVFDPIATPVFSTPRVSLRNKEQRALLRKPRPSDATPDSHPDIADPGDRAEAESIESSGVDCLLTGHPNEYIPPSSHGIEQSNAVKRNYVCRRIDLGDEDESEANSIRDSMGCPNRTPKWSSGPVPANFPTRNSSAPELLRKVVLVPETTQKAPLDSGQIRNDLSASKRKRLHVAESVTKVPTTPPTRRKQPSIPGHLRESDGRQQITPSCNSIRRDRQWVMSAARAGSLPQFPISSYENSGGLLSNHMSLTMESLVPREETATPQAPDNLTTPFQYQAGIPFSKAVNVPSASPRRALHFTDRKVTAAHSMRIRGSSSRGHEDEVEILMNSQGHPRATSLAHGVRNTEYSPALPEQDIETNTRAQRGKMAARKARSPLCMPFITDTEASSECSSPENTATRIERACTPCNGLFPLMPDRGIEELEELQREDPICTPKAREPNQMQTQSTDFVPETPALGVNIGNDYDTEPPSPDIGAAIGGAEVRHGAGMVLCEPMLVSIPAGALRSPSTPESDSVAESR